MLVVWVIVAIIVILFFIFIGIYNGLVGSRNQTKNAWAQIDVQLKRRYDLIPNLVETVKAYAKHERETFQAVTEARAKVGTLKVTKEMLDDPKAMSQFQEAQAGMSSALSRLLLVVERYPDLKANQNFRDLQNQLEGTENRINVARVRYNKTVQDFNTSIRIFPNSVTNSLLLHLKPKEPFKAEPGAEKAPQVKF